MWYVVTASDVFRFTSLDIVRRQLRMTPFASVWRAEDVTRVENNRYLHVKVGARPVTL